MKRMNKKIILICNSENPFLFNRCYYDQVDEVAMGSPLGTVVAKGFDEKKRWLTEYELFPLLVNIMLFPSRSTYLDFSLIRRVPIIVSQKDVLIKWDKVFTRGPSKFCGRQPLKSFKGYGMLKQTISPDFLKTVSHKIYLVYS